MSQVSDSRTSQTHSDSSCPCRDQSTHEVYDSAVFVQTNLLFLDLVPVSSTVIPELEMPSKDTAETDQQYMKAYYSLFKKKFTSKLEKKEIQKKPASMLENSFSKV